MRLHRRDQELCCTSLDMLMRLCICMESEQDDSLCSQEKQDGRILMLHLVDAFW